MKKAIIILMLFVSATSVITSCKKDDKKSEKERVTELLVSGKWYYQYIKDSYGNIAIDCFNNKDYWEFKADGTCTEQFLANESGTYTLSDDGKTVTLSSGLIISVTSINQTEFKFTLSEKEGTEKYEIILSKTAGTGSNCPR